MRNVRLFTWTSLPAWPCRGWREEVGTPHDCHTTRHPRTSHNNPKKRPPGSHSKQFKRVSHGVFCHVPTSFEWRVPFGSRVPSSSLWFEMGSGLPAQNDRRSVQIDRNPLGPDPICGLCNANNTVWHGVITQVTIWHPPAPLPAHLLTVWQSMEA